MVFKVCHFRSVARHKKVTLYLANAKGKMGSWPHDQGEVSTQKVIVILAWVKGLYTLRHTQR